MDLKDRHLLILAAQKLPIMARPFEWMARKLETDEADILIRLQRLKAAGHFDKIGAIFDSRLLGYRHWDIAMSVDHEQVPHAIDLLKEHPGVSFIRLYDNLPNLWFQLVLLRDAKVEEFIILLHRVFYSRNSFLLPLLKLFPVGGHGAESPIASGDSFSSPVGHLADCIRVLQKDLPLSDRPFKILAESIGIKETDLLKKADALLQIGCLKGIRLLPGTVLNPLRLNALSLWALPQEKEKSFESWLASRKSILSCKRRPVYRDLDYRYHIELSLNSQAAYEALENDMVKSFGRWPCRHFVMKESFRKEVALLNEHQHEAFIQKISSTLKNLPKDPPIPESLAGLKEGVQKTLSF